MDEEGNWITCAQSIYGCGDDNLAVRSRAATESALSLEGFLCSLKAEASSPASTRLALVVGP
jgi:hypothetical protein